MQDEEKHYAEWAKKMAEIAIEVAKWHVTDPMLYKDLASDAIEHLLLVERGYPRLNLAENEPYCRRVIQNRIRDRLTAERRRMLHLQPLCDESLPGDEHVGEHEIHCSIDMLFVDENIFEFEEHEELQDLIKRIGARHPGKPRRLLESIQQLDTLDHEVLAKAADIRSADSVRATLSNIQKFAKKLI